MTLRRILTTITLSVFTLGSWVLPRGAEARTPTVFDGRCEATGPAFAEPALSLTPQAGRWWADMYGVCTGTLNGRRISAERVRVVVDADDKIVSCFTGAPVATHTIRFLESRRVLRYDADHVHVAYTTKAARGLGVGYWSIAAVFPEQDVDGIQQCAGDGGLRRWAAGWRLMTLQPLEG